MWKVRHVSDAFFIIREIACSIPVGACCLILLVLPHLFEFSEQMINLFYVLLIISLQGTVYFTVTAPVLLSYQQRVITIDEGTHVHFRVIMTHPHSDVYELFSRHLKFEFSFENLLFYQEATKFSSKSRANLWSSIKAKNLSATEIYNTFIATDSLQQVKLFNNLKKFHLFLLRKLDLDHCRFPKIITKIFSIETHQSTSNTSHQTHQPH